MFATVFTQPLLTNNNNDPSSSSSQPPFSQSALVNDNKLPEKILYFLLIGSHALLILFDVGEDSHDPAVFATAEQYKKGIAKEEKFFELGCYYDMIISIVLCVEVLRSNCIADLGKMSMLGKNQILANLNTQKYFEIVVAVLSLVFCVFGGVLGGDDIEFSQSTEMYYVRDGIRFLRMVCFIWRLLSVSKIEWLK